LSLPWQLHSCRKALPPGFVIVAMFLRRRVRPHHGGKPRQKHSPRELDIPIARDGSIADLLAEARRPDRRLAVVVESIERVARITYVSTKIESELEKAGVALLAADEASTTGRYPTWTAVTRHTARPPARRCDGSNRPSPSGTCSTCWN